MKEEYGMQVPIIAPPKVKMFQLMDSLPTPFLIYDLPGIKHTIEQYKLDVSLIPNAKLNCALKACYVPEVLKVFVDAGLGADTASPKEYDYARKNDFREISATGPSFSVVSQISTMFEEGTDLDVCSLDQLQFIVNNFPGSNIGLRLRLELPRELDGNDTFANNSRFGVNVTDTRLHSLLEQGSLTVTRIHFHIGQLAPPRFLYELQYALMVAKSISTIQYIDFGGGFYDLYVNRAKARYVFKQVNELVKAYNINRSIKFRFEPGAAISGPHGYLVTTIQSIEHSHKYYGYDIVQVDSSAWNFSPWHVPKVFSLDKIRQSVKNNPTRPAILAGNTLYENDFFGGENVLRTPTLDIPEETSIGDKLVVTNFGAYTLTNKRDFNMLGDLPVYLYTGEEVTLSSNGLSDLGKYNG